MTQERTTRAATLIVGMIAVVVATMAMAACGGLAAQQATQPEASVSTSPDVNPDPATSDSGPSPAGQPSLSVTFTMTKGPGEVILRGEMDDGVEGGCLVFRADNGQSYQLIGGDPKVIASGVRLEIVGKVAAGIETSCQQGTPFMVSGAQTI